jgi:hypothetical protein
MEPIRPKSFLPKIFGSGPVASKGTPAPESREEVDSFDFSEHVTANLKPFEKAIHTATSYEPLLLAGLGAAAAGQFGIVAGLIGGAVGFVWGLDGHLGGPIARNLEDLSLSRGRSGAAPPFPEAPARLELPAPPQSSYTNRPRHISPGDVDLVPRYSPTAPSKWASKLWSQVERFLPSGQSKTS